MDQKDVRLRYLKKNCFKSNLFQIKKKFSHLYKKCPKNTFLFFKKLAFMKMSWLFLFFFSSSKIKENKFSNEDWKLKQEMMEAVREMNNSKATPAIDYSTTKIFYGCYVKN